MANEPEFKWFEAEVIGKTTEQRGLFFKRTIYLLAIKMPDLEPDTSTKEVTFDRYSAVQINDKIRVKMYPRDNGKWSFYRESY